MAKIDFKENGSKGLESNKDGIQKVQKFAPKSEIFWVTLTKPISHPKINIEIGDHALVNCEKRPKLGDLVVCGRNIEFWDGQKSIVGVVTQISKHVFTRDNGVPHHDVWELKGDKAC